MAEKSELKLGIILNYVNMGLGSLVPLLYTPIMLSLLGQEEYGLYQLSSTATSYLNLISLGLGAAVTRYLIKAKAEGGQEAEEKMLGLFLLVFQCIAALVFVLGIALVFNLDIWYSDSLTDAELKKMQVLVFIMVCNMAISFSVSPYMSIVTAREKFLFYQAMNILLTVGTPVINLIALLMGYASIGLAVSSIAITVVVRVIYYIYIKRNLRIHAKYKGLPLYCLKEILIFSFWIFVGNIVGQLYSATDIMMIGAVPALATVGVAVYNIGNVFNSMVLSITTGISNLLTPRTNKMVFSGVTNETLTEYSILVGRLQCYLISVLVAGFIIFGKPLIHFYIGDAYLDAYWVALFVMVPNIIPLSQSVCLSILIAKNQHKFRSLMYLAIAIANVIGTWLVLQDWGIKGAAFMSGLGLIIGNGLVMNWYYWKKMGLDIGKFWKEMCKVLAVPLLICVLGIVAGNYIDFYNIIPLLTGILVFTVLTGAGQYIFSFNNYEKNLILTPIKRITHKIKN